MNAPSSPDSVSRNMPVSWFLTVTVTPGSEAPCRVEHPAAHLRRPLLRTGRSHHQQPGEHPNVNTSTHQCLRRLTLVQENGPAPCRNTER